jgi:hypothetical protein
MGRIRSRISEFFFGGMAPLRSRWRSPSQNGLFHSNRPAFDKTAINYDMARQLYRNDGNEWKLGSGFCRPIVDLPVAFMGLPIADTNDEIRDNFINTAIKRYWADELQQAYRNTLRDSRTIVRIRQKGLGPLVGDEERLACYLEIVDPERVDPIVRDPLTGEITEVTITHFVDILDETTTIQQERRQQEKPMLKEHEIWETITTESFTYFDKTDNAFLTELAQENTWGFVPLVEFFNEFDSALSGGMCEFESAMPFIRGFHDVMVQSLQAHKYHSIPKVKFRINDVQTFLRNNFPDSFGADGQFTGEVSWKGREIIFVESEEDVGFVEASSVLGDSKILLDFLFDCICVASETPEWAFMRVEQTTQGALNAQTIPFEKKMERKRISFAKYTQQVIKMLLAISERNPVVATINWLPIRPEQFAAYSQGIQQLIMGLEVAAQRRIISDRTYRETLRQHLDRMKGPEQEAADAENNFEPIQPTNTPIESPNGGGANE